MNKKIMISLMMPLLFATPQNSLNIGVGIETTATASTVPAERFEGNLSLYAKTETPWMLGEYHFKVQNRYMAHIGSSFGTLEYSTSFGNKNLLSMHFLARVEEWDIKQLCGIGYERKLSSFPGVSITGKIVTELADSSQYTQISISILKDYFSSPD